MWSHSTMGTFVTITFKNSWKSVTAIENLVYVCTASTLDNMQNGFQRSIEHCREKINKTQEWIIKNVMTARGDWVREE